MKIVIDSMGFEIEERRSAKAKRLVLVGVRKEVSRQAMTTKRRIQQDMPIDTGRARASWGNPVPIPYVEGAGINDGVWEEKDSGMTVIQGSRVPYIEALNEGHSQQAPAGFIDAAEEDAIRSLENAILDVVARTF